MEKTNIDEIKQQVDELTTRFNQLLFKLGNSEPRLKEPIDFDELEINQEDEEVDNENTVGIDDEDNLIN